MKPQQISITHHKAEDLRKNIYFVNNLMVLFLRYPPIPRQETHTLAKLVLRMNLATEIQHNYFLLINSQFVKPSQQT